MRSTASSLTPIFRALLLLMLNLPTIGEFLFLLTLSFWAGDFEFTDPNSLPKSLFGVVVGIFGLEGTEAARV